MAEIKDKKMVLEGLSGEEILALVSAPDGAAVVKEIENKVFEAGGWEVKDSPFFYFIF